MEDSKQRALHSLRFPERTYPCWGIWVPDSARSSRTVSSEERDASMCAALDESLAIDPESDIFEAVCVCMLVYSSAYLLLAIASKASQLVKEQTWALVASKVVEAR